MSKENRYEFTVELSGYGLTEIDAWHNAIEAFFNDPGLPTLSFCVRDEEESDENKDRLLRYIQAQCSEV